MKIFLCLILRDRSSFESIPPLSSVYLPSSLCGPGLEPRGPHTDPKVCYGSAGENVLRLRSGLDQVALLRYVLPLD